MSKEEHLINSVSIRILILRARREKEYAGMERGDLEQGKRERRPALDQKPTQS